MIIFTKNYKELNNGRIVGFVDQIARDVRHLISINSNKQYGMVAGDMSNQRNPDLSISLFNITDVVWLEIAKNISRVGTELYHKSLVNDIKSVVVSLFTNTGAIPHIVIPYKHITSDPDYKEFSRYMLFGKYHSIISTYDTGTILRYLDTCLFNPKELSDFIERYNGIIDTDAMRRNNMILDYFFTKSSIKWAKDAKNNAVNTDVKIIGKPSGTNNTTPVQKPIDNDGGKAIKDMIKKSENNVKSNQDNFNNIGELIKRSEAINPRYKNIIAMINTNKEADVDLHSGDFITYIGTRYMENDSDDPSANVYEIIIPNDISYQSNGKHHSMILARCIANNRLCLFSKSDEKYFIIMHS